LIRVLDELRLRKREIRHDPASVPGAQAGQDAGQAGGNLDALCRCGEAEEAEE